MDAKDSTRENIKIEEQNSLENFKTTPRSTVVSDSPSVLIKSSPSEFLESAVGFTESNTCDGISSPSEELQKPKNCGRTPRWTEEEVSSCMLRVTNVRSTCRLSFLDLGPSP